MITWFMQKKAGNKTNSVYKFVFVFCFFVNKNCKKKAFILSVIRALLVLIALVCGEEISQDKKYSNIGTLTFQVNVIWF